jgi:hypothetical protein
MLGTLEKMALATQSQGNQANSRAIRPPASTVADDIAEYENSIGGSILLSLRAWREIVGSVSLVGGHPTLCPGALPGGPGIFINPEFTMDAEQRAAELRAVGVNATTELRKQPEPPLADPLAIACNFEEDAEKHHRRLVLGIDDHTKAGIPVEVAFTASRCRTLGSQMRILGIGTKPLL